MDLNTALNEKKFDVRLLEHNLTAGTITQQDLDKKIRELPDLTNQSEGLKMDNSTNSDRYNL